MIIKIFNENDTDFSTNGNIVIQPYKCIEVKKKSLNGWYLEVELPIKYKKYIVQRNLVVVKTKSKLNPQAFRIESPDYNDNLITFTARHVMFDAENYMLADARPTKLNGINALNYINSRTDNISPFSMYSDVPNVKTAYFIRKSLLEAWATIEERWGGSFDADNWNISLRNDISEDYGDTLYYGKDLEGIEVKEDWSNVCTKILPTGSDGLKLPELYVTADVQYKTPYTRTLEFPTELEDDEKTDEALVKELRQNAINYLNENQYPRVSYTVNSNIKQNIEIGTIVHVKHPLVNIKTEVLEYTHDINNDRVTSLTFGNYAPDVKTKFETYKDKINEINQNISSQQAVIDKQTKIINTKNTLGKVVIGENEIFILDRIPKEQAKNVWRWGLGGLGFSSSGMEGPFTIAMTQDGKINADFITTGSLNVSRINGLNGEITSVVQSNNNTLKSEINNNTQLQITQAQNNLRLEWSGDINDAQNASNQYTDGQIADIHKYIHFDDGKIYLGTDASPFKVIISNEKIAFMEDNSEVAYISNNKFNFEQGSLNLKEGQSTFDLGNWHFVPQSNGNLSLKYYKK